MGIDDMIRHTGKGEDRKGGRRDGLRLRWSWLMRRELSGAPPNDRRRLPCQTCRATRKTSHGVWEYRAVAWHDSYEADVELNGKPLAQKEGFTSRVRAQFAAEQLMRDFCRRALDEGV